ncbi:SGNH/GDSL hydrolase family protein [Streptomyces sp. NRRL F-5630]|uniref:SGNH/GDSL hydrolase family protein n=1 Tax=Streptomyces sp. NRRL F-5630 TaxID=1463864 RepID=UPI003EBA3C2E
MNQARSRGPFRTAVSLLLVLGSAALLGSPSTAAPPEAPPRPLSQLFDNRGIGTGARGGGADLDGHGRALSAEALRDAGWSPGAGLTVVGAPLRLPASPPGSPDNVRADGQRVSVTGRGDALAFLVTATGGRAPGRGTVEYADGRRSSYQLEAPDWRTGTLATSAVVLPRVSTPEGPMKARARLYVVTVPLSYDAPVRAVTLPRDPVGPASLHVFALGVRPRASGWTGSWSAATAARMRVGPWQDPTLRLVVRPSVGGERVRLRFDNTFAASPVRLGRVSVAVREKGATARGKPVPLRFGGHRGVTLAAGAQVRSDPLPFRVEAGTDLLVSVSLPGRVASLPVRTAAKQPGYVADAAGNRTGSRGGAGFAEALDYWPLLTGLDVAGGPGSVVALGDSTTTGAKTRTGADERWTDVLAARLRSQDAVPRYGVLNQALTANRLLADRYPGAGEDEDTSGVRLAHRLDRDLFAQTSARTALVYLGLNDVRWGSSAAEVRTALAEVARRARARGVRVLAATLTPCGGGSRCTPAVEERRQAVNAWLRAGGGGFDAVVDFDHVVRDPERPGRLLPAYDSGDHLHPSAEALARMAGAVDLGALRPR